MIFKEGKVLLGKRKGAHGEGEYCFPGGHLEYMESFEECARREVWEETGIEIENVRFLSLTNLKAYAPRHFVNINVTADWKSGKQRVREPDKCAGWDWYDLENLPSPLFAVIPHSLEAYKGGRNYFDA